MRGPSLEMVWPCAMCRNDLQRYIKKTRVGESIGQEQKLFYDQNRTLLTSAWVSLSFSKQDSSPQSSFTCQLLLCVLQDRV